MAVCNTTLNYREIDAGDTQIGLRDVHTYVLHPGRLRIFIKDYKENDSSCNMCEHPPQFSLQTIRQQIPGLRNGSPHMQGPKHLSSYLKMGVFSTCKSQPCKLVFTHHLIIDDHNHKCDAVWGNPPPPNLSCSPLITTAQWSPPVFPFLPVASEAVTPDHHPHLLLVLGGGPCKHNLVRRTCL